MVVTGCTGGDDGDTPIKKKDVNWNSTFHERKMVFRIPVGDIPEEEIEDYVHKVAEKFKNANQPIPDLDCGIYLPDQDIEYYLPTKNKLKMERDNVYKRIDGERDYQDKTWVARRTLDGTPDEEKSVAEWINYIEFHVSKAKDKVYHLDTQAALAEIRKIAALAVRAMEIHGAPERENLTTTNKPINTKSGTGTDTCSCGCEK